METVDPIDYSYPVLLAQQRIKAAHDALLKRELALGAEELTNAIAELRTAVVAIRHMQGE